SASAVCLVLFGFVAAAAGVAAKAATTNNITSFLIDAPLATQLCRLAIYHQSGRVIRHIGLCLTAPKLLSSSLATALLDRCCRHPSDTNKAPYKADRPCQVREAARSPV